MTNANSVLAAKVSRKSAVRYDNLANIGSSAHMILARNITSANFSIEDRVITMHLISSPEGRDNVSENGTYKVHLRPTEEEG